MGMNVTIWQKPDNELTLDDPGNKWVDMWSFTIQRDRTGNFELILTGEKHRLISESDV
jgi:hypothetical protein